MANNIVWYIVMTVCLFTYDTGGYIKSKHKYGIILYSEVVVGLISLYSFVSTFL